MDGKATLLQRRIISGAVICVAAYMLVVLRLADVTLFAPEAKSGRPATEMVTRADLVDRNGTLLARDVRVYDVYANPVAFNRKPWPRKSAEQAKWMADQDAAAHSIAAALAPTADHSAAYLYARFHSRAPTAEDAAKNRSRYVLVARRITVGAKKQLAARNLKGVEFINAAQRNYPQGRMTAQIIGVTDGEGNGVSGLERGLDARIKRDAVNSAGNGSQVVSSLDARVQFVLENETRATREKFRARAAGALVMNVRTGEVLGLVSLPDFDPNDRRFVGDDTMRNIMTQNVYELGSVFKVMAFSLGLEDHTFSPDEVFPIGKSITVGGHAIREAERMPDTLEARDVLALSSNIGTSQIALRSGGARQRQFLTRMGLMSPLATELPESPRTLYPRNWGPLETATIGFGHGISVTPLAYCAAAAAVVNGGLKVTPTFLKHPSDARGARVLSPATSNTMRMLLRYVVTNGTGKMADVPGYEVGGKTGSAEKPGPDGGYQRHKLMTSFLGVFPMSSPRYLVFVILDEPQSTKDVPRALAGMTAVPLAGRIIAHVAPFLDVPMRPVAGTVVQGKDNT